jgi:hypothetical protein
MGRTGDSGRNLGLDGLGKNAISSAKLAAILKRPPRFEIRADNGRFLLSPFLGKPLMRREMLETYPPFLLGNFLSGIENGRDKLIQAKSGLG